MCSLTTGRGYTSCGSDMGLVESSQLRFFFQWDFVPSPKGAKREVNSWNTDSNEMIIALKGTQSVRRSRNDWVGMGQSQRTRESILRYKKSVLLTQYAQIMHAKSSEVYHAAYLLLSPEPL